MSDESSNGTSGRIVIDPVSHRPLATVSPVPGAPRMTPRPIAVATTNGDGESCGGNGRLTDAQREGLTRLIQANPKLPPDKIGEMFESRYGRTIGIKTVLQYVAEHGVRANSGAKAV